MDKLKEEFDRVKGEICSISYLKKGSLSKCYQTCGTPGCKCHKDKKYRHGPTGGGQQKRMVRQNPY